MNIKATVTIEIRLNEHHVYKLTKAEAELLHAELSIALNKSSYIKYPDGVRGGTGDFVPNPYNITCQVNES